MDYKNCIIFSVRHEDVDEFYVITSFKTKHYLFSSRHCKSVHCFFEKGVRYENATDFSKAKRNTRICRIMERLPSAVRYISKEYYCA